MDICSLLNIDLGDLNDSSFILKNDRLSMCNTIYIFLEFMYSICKRTKTYILMKTKYTFAQLHPPIKCTHATVFIQNMPF